MYIYIYIYNISIDIDFDVDVMFAHVEFLIRHQNLMLAVDVIPLAHDVSVAHRPP